MIFTQEELVEAARRGAVIYCAAAPKNPQDEQDALISRMGLVFALAFSLKNSTRKERETAALEALRIAWEIIDAEEARHHRH